MQLDFHFQNYQQRIEFKKLYGKNVENRGKGEIRHIYKGI